MNKLSQNLHKNPEFLLQRWRTITFLTFFFTKKKKSQKKSHCKVYEETISNNKNKNKY
jgi:hypothetical protein